MSAVADRAIALLRGVRRQLLASPWRSLRCRTAVVTLAGCEAAARLTLVGAGSSLDYVLSRLAPAGGVEQGRGGRVRLARLAAALEEGQSGSDLVVARVPRLPGAAFGLGGCLAAPELVDAVLCLNAPGRWPPRSARSNIRRIEQAGLSWSFSRRREDFDRFYRDLYVPYARARFGAAAVLRSRMALRASFARGGLQHFFRSGRLVAAQLVEIHDRQLDCVAVGAALDGSDPRRNGVMAATTFYAVEHARSLGLDRVNLGGSLPSLTDPVLASKLYWGFSLASRPQSDHDLLFGWKRWSPAVAAVLAILVLIVRTPAGLVALDARRSAGGARGRRGLATGLARLVRLDPPAGRAGADAAGAALRGMSSPDLSRRLATLAAAPDDPAGCAA